MLRNYKKVNRRELSSRRLIREYISQTSKN